MQVSTWFPWRLAVKHQRVGSHNSKYGAFEGGPLCSKVISYSFCFLSSSFFVFFNFLLSSFGPFSCWFLFGLSLLLYACASHHHSLDFYLYFRVWQNSVCRLMYDIGLYLLLGTNKFAGVVKVVGHYHTCFSWGKMWETIASVHSQFLFFSVLLSWLFLFSSSYCCYGLFCLVCNFFTHLTIFTQVGSESNYTKGSW